MIGKIDVGGASLEHALVDAKGMATKWNAPVCVVWNHRTKSLNILERSLLDTSRTNLDGSPNKSVVGDYPSPYDVIYTVHEPYSRFAHLSPVAGPAAEFFTE